MAARHPGGQQSTGKDITRHELFLTTSVYNDDIPRAVRILQGYCGMKPQASLRRRLVWEGPRQRPGLRDFDPAFISRQPPGRAEAWKYLHGQMIRQSYIITLIYEVERSAFGQAQIHGAQRSSEEVPDRNRTLSCDQSPGTLKWTELPDPVDSRTVNTRLMLQIENEKGLCTVIQSIGYRFTRQMIQECYQFINGNVLFELSRYLQLPEDVDGTSQTQSHFDSPLPAFEHLTPFDSQNKWVLTISANVFNGKDQVQMQQGISELMAIKTEFEGCFNFHMVGRLTLDTRVKIIG
ncbi:mediator complex, subunit Med18 [Amylocarpus encephaloides]|uniref:Mediator of RNA polymerase II transcription subunit 18 n=1 Tax=Amylocarpus encephaloides TaxID=45428 RepID=A0A9P7YKW2_9HELO|nr:mediator complex, subunit Med18 [Amylocarpus encephaloides]